MEFVLFLEKDSKKKFNVQGSMFEKTNFAIS